MGEASEAFTYTIDVAFQKNPDYFPESCVSPPTPEPTTTAEPTPHPTMENGLSACYIQFTTAHISGGVWDSASDLTEEECKVWCSDDSECVGYSMTYDVFDSSTFTTYDKCNNYHGETSWDPEFYTAANGYVDAEVISFKKVLPAPENCEGYATYVAPAVGTTTSAPTPGTTTPEVGTTTSAPTPGTTTPVVGTTTPVVGTTTPPPSPGTTTPPFTTTSPSQAAVKFTQVVFAAEVDCETTKTEVQTANAQALGVPESSVDVSGCEERRVLAADNINAATWEFLVSVITVDSASAEVLRDQIAAEDYVNQVQAHLLTTAISSSSNPEIETSESVYASSSSDNMEAKSHIVFLPILALLCLAVIGVCCGVYFCCKSRKEMPKETPQVPDLIQTV